VTINEFSLKDFPIQREEKLQEFVEKEKTNIQKLQHQIETIQTQIKEEQKRLKETQDAENDLSKIINELEKKIADIDEKKIEMIKKQKQKNAEQLEKYEDTLPKKIIRNFIQKTKSDHITTKSDITVPNIYLEIQSLISKGKTLNETMKHIQAQIQNEELLTKTQQEKVKTQAKYLEEKIAVQTDQLKKTQQMLNDIDKNIKVQATFECKKIQANCPFIKVINKKNFEQLESQKLTMIGQKEDIEKNIEQLVAERKLLNNICIQPDTKKIKELQKEQTDTEKTIENIKMFLSEIGYKSIEKTYLDYIAKEKEIKQLDQQINTMEQESKKAEDRKLQIQKAITQKEIKEKQVEELIQTIAKKEEQQKQLEIEKEQSNYTAIVQIEKNHLAMKQLHHDIQVIIDEFKEHQLEIQRLKEQEEIL